MTNAAFHQPEVDKKIRVVVLSFCDNCRGITAEDREDLLQESRLACWRWVVTHPGEDLGLGLVRLLTAQACSDWERATRKHREMDPIPDAYDQGRDGEQEYAAMLGDILAKIVNDEAEAGIALLFFYQELSIREVADFLEIPKTTVARTVQLMRDRATALGIVEVGRE